MSAHYMFVRKMVPLPWVEPMIRRIVQKVLQPRSVDVAKSGIGKAKAASSMARGEKILEK